MSVFNRMVSKFVNSNVRGELCRRGEGGMVVVVTKKGEGEK